jgi:ketosteroid isomerase-like protein
MRRFDQDPELLRKIAEAAVHSADEAWIHMEAEFAGKIPELMETLVAEGPYAYTIMPQVHPDGRITLPIVTTRQGVEDCYKMVRGASDLLSAEPLVDIRAPWYNFTESLNRGRIKGSDVVMERQTAAIFPTCTGKGITGELVWARMPRDKLGRGPKTAESGTEDLALRRYILAAHDRYVEALRKADVEAIVDVMNEDVQGVVRDYVNETGTLTVLDGREAHRVYYKALFAMYDVQSVGIVERVVQEWYAFSELRFTMRRRSSGDVVAFHTAEFFVPASDRRFIARIGHGTDVHPVR